MISGFARGRKLRAVPGSTTRPITDRVKEALFNIIGADVRSASFLDLFAGTGSVGIEALSRGAGTTWFVDNDRLAIETVQTNLKIIGLENDIQVLRMDAFGLLASGPKRSFDYVYIAPPQYKGLWKRALLSLEANPDWLSEDAWVVVQIHPREYERLELQNLAEFDQRRYGSTLLVFYSPVTLERPSSQRDSS